MTPTIDRVGPYRFFFFSNETGEPAHVHVQDGRKLAKFWLEPVSLAGSTRFAAHELTDVERIVRDRQAQFLEAWNEFFKS